MSVEYNDKSPFDTEHLKYLFFSSEGRVNRRRYWIGFLILLPIWLIPAIILLLIHPLLYFLGFLIGVYPSIMILIKRAHDRNRSGHFIWICLIPLVSLWPAIELPFIKGTHGPNRFGPDPLQ